MRKRLRKAHIANEVSRCTRGQLRGTASETWPLSQPSKENNFCNNDVSDGWNSSHGPVHTTMLLLGVEAVANAVAAGAEAVAGLNDRQEAEGIEVSLPVPREGMDRRLYRMEEDGGDEEVVVSGRWLTEDNGSGEGSGNPPDKAEPGEGSGEQSPPPLPSLLSPPSMPSPPAALAASPRPGLPPPAPLPATPPPEAPLYPVASPPVTSPPVKPPSGEYSAASEPMPVLVAMVAGFALIAALFAVLLKAFYSKRACWTGASEYVPSGGRYEHRQSETVTDRHRQSETGTDSQADSQRKTQPKPRTTIKVVRWVTPFEPHFWRQDVRPPRISRVVSDIARPRAPSLAPSREELTGMQGRLA